MNSYHRFEPEKQSVFVRAISPETMNQDMSVPIDLIKKYKESGQMWHFSEFMADLGCGDGHKTAKIFNELGLGGVAIDISPGMIELAQKRILMSLCGDLMDESFVEAVTASGHFGEVYGSVNMQGLLVNVPGGREKILAVADRLVTPGGHLFVTEVMRCDEYNPVLMREMGEQKYHAYISAWKHRYAVNEHIGLPYGTVVVAKPGVNKQLEWGSQNDLLSILEGAGETTSVFERICEHQSVDALRDSLEVGSHYEIREQRYGAVASRVSSHMYPTIVIAARKPPYFRYFPGLIGEHRSHWGKHVNVGGSV